MDDDFMSKVFEDIKCAEFLLQIILNRDDLKVKKSNSQYSVKNLQGKSVRLDITLFQVVKNKSPHQYLTIKARLFQAVMLF